MIKWFEKIIKYWIVGVLIFLFASGLEKMYFHQDDILLLAGLATDLPKLFFQPASGHLIFLFNLFYFLEWKLFQLNFGGYLLISILIHALVLWVVMKIIDELSGKKLWALLGALAVVVNSNFYEVIWMSSSQMMSISTLFSLLSLWLVVRLDKLDRLTLKDQGILLFTSLIPGLTWGTGLPMPFWLILAFGWKKNKGKIKLKQVFWPLLIAQFCLLIVYLRLATGSSSLYVHPKGYIMTLYEMLRFTSFAVAYSVIGRYFFPFANRLGRQVMFIFSLVYVYKFVKIKNVLKFLKTNGRIWIFTALVLFGSYVLISIPRWQFGLGQAAAPRYAYLPMMFLAIAVFSSLAKVNINSKQIPKIMAILLLFSALSLGGFMQVIIKWTERPNKNRVLFENLQLLKPDQCLVDSVLPWYIVESDKWKISYIWPIFNKNFDPFKEDKNCITVKRDVTEPWQPFTLTQ